MLTAYEKDPISKIVLINFGGDLKAGNPQLDPPLDYYHKTHQSSTVLIPSVNEPFEIIFKTAKLTKTIISGTTPSTVGLGKVAPLQIYVKILPPVIEPLQPEEII